MSLPSTPIWRKMHPYTFVQCAALHPWYSPDYTKSTPAVFRHIDAGLPDEWVCSVILPTEIRPDTTTATRWVYENIIPLLTVTRALPCI